MPYGSSRLPPTARVAHAETVNRQVTVLSVPSSALISKRNSIYVPITQVAAQSRRGFQISRLARMATRSVLHNTAHSGHDPPSSGSRHMGTENHPCLL